MAFILISFCSFQPIKPVAYGINTVVIDAGHGGHDPGCLGKRSKEKDVTLSISLKLGKYIEEHFPDVKVIYTRKTDEFVELYERADIANNAKADLFICIHCNSACTFNKKKKKEVCATETFGVESWVMGLHKTEANLEVAKRENEVILMEKDYTRQYGGFDPNSPEANIIFSLYQNTYLDQSLRMATYIQNEIKTKGRTARGVKQAGFWVLYKTTMPSVLVETGFLSNPAEEKYLASEKGQDEIAHSIYKAFKSYKSSVELLKNETAESKPDLPEEKKVIESPKVESKPIVKDSVKLEEKKVKDTPVAEVKSIDKDSTLQGGKEIIPSPIYVKKSVRDSIAKATAKKSEIKAEKKEDKKEIKPIEPITSSAADEIFWSVQFYTSPKSLPANHKVNKAFDKVKEFVENGTYKYATGMLKDKNEAIRLQGQVREMGYKDAFIVAFLNNKKITVKEATEKLLQKIN